MKKKILIIGTYDTKEDELRYLEHIIMDQGGATVTHGCKHTQRPD